MGVDYIDNQLEENCDSTSGQIGQITGWDEGQCQDGRDSRDLLSSLSIFIAPWWIATNAPTPNIMAPGIIIARLSSPSVMFPTIKSGKPTMYHGCLDVS